MASLEIIDAHKHISYLVMWPVWTIFEIWFFFKKIWNSNILVVNENLNYAGNAIFVQKVLSAFS